MKRGFYLGKYMPPHRGHLFVCETAMQLVDELTVLVCALPDDPIAGPLRFAWMKEMLPRARVLYHDAVVPQTPAEHPDFWRIWTEHLQNRAPRTD
jgi:HTH-type transcriptional repressor of NAD biosynthesis genes